MIRGGRGGGFVFGAVGGLALALLLVGVVAYLPQSNQAILTGAVKNSLAATSTTSCVDGCGTPSTPQAGAAATSSSSTVSSISSETSTMTTAESTTTAAASSASIELGNGVPPPILSTSQAAPSGTTTATTTAHTVGTGTITTSTISTSTVIFYSATAPSSQSYPSTVSGASSSNGVQRPSSLLTVLPGESVGSMVATLSPLLVGLLIAALVYGAYSRRQDASS